MTYTLWTYPWAHMYEHTHKYIHRHTKSNRFSLYSPNVKYFVTLPTVLIFYSWNISCCMVAKLHAFTSLGFGIWPGNTDLRRSILIMGKRIGYSLVAQIKNREEIINLRPEQAWREHLVLSPFLGRCNASNPFYIWRLIGDKWLTQRIRVE